MSINEFKLSGSDAVFVIIVKEIKRSKSLCLKDYTFTEDSENKMHNEIKTILSLCLILFYP